MDRWLQMVASNSYILRMQSMYQFLCIDANLPPPYLEIHWRDSANGSFEEMDMEEMFDGRDDEMNEDDDEDEDEDEDDEDDEEDEEEEEEEFDVDIDDVPAAEQKPAQVQQQSVFGFGGQGAASASPAEKKKRTASKGGDKAQGKNKRAAGHEAGHHQHHGQTASQYAVNRHASQNQSHAAAEMEDENDGLDIQSLSVVEAEFIYNKIDEGKNQGIIEKKRTINLEAFKIIRVIGKGKTSMHCELSSTVV